MDYNLVFIILYFIILTVVILTGRKKKSSGSYLIAERKLGVWATVSTLFSTYRSASGFVALVTLGVIFGLGAIWLTAGMLLSLFYLAIIVPKIRKLSDERKLLTIPDYFNEVFGKNSAFLVAILIVIMGLIFIIAQFFVSGNILVNLLPISFFSATLLIGIPIAVYLFFRGYDSVVRTDVFQWLIIIVFLVIPFTLIGSSGLNVKVSSFLSPGWIGIAGFVISGFFVTLMGADTWQRIYSAKNVKTARTALLITGPAFFIFNAVIVLFGIMLRNLVGGIAPDKVFYVGFQNILSPLAASLLLIILLASIMSTIDTYVFVNSLTFVKNIFLRKNVNKKLIAKKTKIFLLIYLLLAMILVLFASRFLNLVFGATTILTIMAPSAVYSFYKYKKYKLKDWSVVLSIIFGVLVHLPLFFLGKFTTPIYLIYPLIAASIGLLIGEVFIKK